MILHQQLSPSKSTFYFNVSRFCFLHICRNITLYPGGGCCLRRHLKCCHIRPLPHFSSSFFVSISHSSWLWPTFCCPNLRLSISMRPGVAPAWRLSQSSPRLRWTCAGSFASATSTARHILIFVASRAFGVWSPHARPLLVIFCDMYSTGLTKSGISAG